MAESDDDDDDEVDEPLADGVNSVSWLPSVVGAKKVEADTKGGEVSEYLFICKRLDVVLKIFAFSSMLLGC